MSTYLLLQIALTLSLLTLIGFIIYVLMQVGRTLRNFDELLVTLNKDIPSILSKLQLTLNGVNTEMDRVEQIVSSFQEVSERVQSTTGLVRRAVSSPLIKVSSVASGASAALSKLIGRRGRN